MIKTFVLNKAEPVLVKNNAFFGPFSLDFHRRKLLGLDRIKDKKIVFAGCARDIPKETFDANIDGIRSVGRFFLQTKIIVVENDSTNDFLQTLQNKDIDHLLSYRFNFKKLGMGRDEYRVKILGTIRNIYVDYIRKHYHDYDYVCVFDYDLTDWRDDGFFSSFGIDNWDICGANGIQYIDENTPIYYDSFAFLDTKYNQTPSGTDIPIFEFNKNAAKVRSCGGGLILYSMKEFLNNRRYGVAKINGNVGSEHINFNIYPECNTIINPNMITMR